MTKQAEQFGRRITSRPDDLGVLDKPLSDKQIRDNAIAEKEKRDAILGPDPDEKKPKQ